MSYLLYTVIIPMVGHNVVFRISLHMPIVMVMTTVLPPLRIATRVIVIKFVSILSSPPKVGAKKFLGNLGAARALLGTVRMKKASTATTKSTILNVVSLRVLTSWTAKTNIETAGMEVTIRLEMTQHNIVRILSQEVAKSSK